MKISSDNILDFLKTHSGWQNAETIAVQYGISTRTVRNHINKINSSEEIVESSQIGYRLRRIKASVHVDTRRDEANIAERIFMLLFTSTKSELSLTEIINRIFFSESTIRKIIQDFNKANQHRHVKITIKRNLVGIEGDEFNVRKLFHALIGKEIKDGPSKSLEMDIQRMLPGIPISKLQDIITNAVNKNDLVVNGYEMNNLLLHYAISINRIVHGNGYDDAIDNGSLISRPEYGITKEITSIISSLFDIRFNDFEVKGLTLALIGKTIVRNAATQRLEDLKKFIPIQIIKTCLNVVSDVDKEYKLELESPTFLVKFIIHVNNMVARAQLNAAYPNQEFDYLTKQYPLLYDLSLFILKDISERLSVKIDKRESVYLLLHLGVYMDTIEDNRINTAIIVPEYYDTASRIADKIDRLFSEDIHIAQIVSNGTIKPSMIESRLVISTTNVAVSKNSYLVNISPLLSSLDVSKVRAKIDEIKHDINAKKIVEYVKQYTNRSTFIRTDKHISKEISLNMAAEKLENLGYVNDDFLENLKQRENMASTLFGLVAIPHPLKMNANKTGILIMVNSHGIKWAGDNLCHLMLMIAVKKDDIKIFGDLLQALIDVLSVKKNVYDLIGSTSYEDFLLRLERQIKESKMDQL